MKQKQPAFTERTIPVITHVNDGLKTTQPLDLPAKPNAQVKTLYNHQAVTQQMARQYQPRKRSS